MKTIRRLIICGLKAAGPLMILTLGTWIVLGIGFKLIGG